MGRGLIPLLLAVMAAVCGIGVWRLIVALRKRREPGQREDALQYEIWYVLRQKDAAAADRFLTGLRDRMLAERSRFTGNPAAGSEMQKLVETQVAEMARAVDMLKRAHAGEPELPPALADLESRVKQLCGDLAALQPGEAP